MDENGRSSKHFQILDIMAFFTKKYACNGLKVKVSSLKAHLTQLQCQYSNKGRALRVSPG